MEEIVYSIGKWALQVSTALCAGAAILHLYLGQYPAAQAYATCFVGLMLIPILAGIHQTAYWNILDQRRREARERRKSDRIAVDAGVVEHMDNERFWAIREDDESLWFRGGCRAGAAKDESA